MGRGVVLDTERTGSWELKASEDWVSEPSEAKSRPGTKRAE